MLFNKDDFILSIPHQFRHMIDWQALASTTLWGFTIAETVRYIVTAVSLMFRHPSILNSNPGSAATSEHPPQGLPFVWSQPES